MTTQTKAPDLLSTEYWNSTIKMSLSKFFILCAVNQKPMYGYEAAKEVEIITNGSCSPTEGTIYPVLKQFEEGGYVESKSSVVDGRTRKTYTVTDKGREAFAIAHKEWLDMTQCLMTCKPSKNGVDCSDVVD